MSEKLRLAGIDPATEEGKEFVRRMITRPLSKTELNINKSVPPFKVPEGFMLVDPNDYTKGVTPIPGGSKDNLSGENASKAQMLKNAKIALDQAEELLFLEDGTIDAALLASAAVNLPRTDGRAFNIFMEQGIQAITRNETGAAMAPSELQSTRDRFKPSILDDEPTQRAKLKLFRNYLDGTLKMLDPSGRFSADRFQTHLDQEVARQRSSKKKKKDLTFNPQTGRLE